MLEMYAVSLILHCMKIVIGRQMLVIFRKTTLYAHTFSTVEFLHEYKLYLFIIITTSTIITTYWASFL